MIICILSENTVEVKFYEKYRFITDVGKMTWQY